MIMQEIVDLAEEAPWLYLQEVLDWVAIAHSIGLALSTLLPTRRRPDPQAATLILQASCPVDGHSSNTSPYHSSPIELVYSAKHRIANMRGPSHGTLTSNLAATSLQNSGVAVLVRAGALSFPSLVRLDPAPSSLWHGYFSLWLQQRCTTGIPSFCSP
jgi:hypothetical protein